MNEKRFFTVAEYQNITGRSPASASRDIKEGRVPVTRIGKTVLIPASFFENLEQDAYTAISESQGGKK